MWWRNAIPKHLPVTQGPFVPGCFDLMNGFSDQSTFVRIYYPSNVKKEENDHSKWFKWLPHEGYVDGFAKVVNSWPSVLKLIIWSYGGEPLVPCMWEAPIVERSNEEQMPVILYSHGFGASRFISATIGAELASRGFLFAAIEHRENSACATYYYESQEKLEKKEETWIPHEKMLFGPDHYTIRNAQLHKRMTEFKRLINLIEELNSGTAKNILPSNFDISSLKDRLQTNSIHAMGHSFGGATSLLTMAHDKRLKSGTLLDSWMFPLKDEKLSVEQPLIFVNSQTFHIPTNLAIIEKYLQEPAGSSHDVFTIRNTSHDLQTDIPYIMGSWLNWFMRKLDSVIGTNINNHLILRFYNQHIGFPSSIEESEKYLEEKKEHFINGTISHTKEAKRGIQHAITS